MLSTEWTSGGQIRVHTSKFREFDDEETPAQFARRHVAELEEIQEVLEIDPR